jgi:hypothetical protein
MGTAVYVLFALAHAGEPGAEATVEPPPDPADARKVSVTVTDDFEARYWLRDQRLPDPDDVPIFNYFEQVDRVNVLVASGKWNAKLQVDEVLLGANRYYLDDVLYVERPLLGPDVYTPFPEGVDLYVNPEKVQVTTERKWGSATLGDAYVAFGRGVGLNLNRNVDIDIDTSVQGAKVLLRPGAWDVTLAAGTANRQQVFQDNPNINMSPDLRHKIAGLRAERFGLGPFNLGAHGVFYDFVRAPGFESLGQAPEADTVVGGATAEFVGIGGLDGYVEYDAFGYGGDPRERPAPCARGTACTRPPPRTRAGSSCWGSSSDILGVERVNSLLTPELYEVAVAPTLEYERVILEDPSAAVNSNDIWGRAGCRVDYAAIPRQARPRTWRIAGFRDLDTAGLHFNSVPESIGHATAGLEWIDGEFGLTHQHRLPVRGPRRAARSARNRLAHVDLSTNFPLPGDFVGYVSAASRYFAWGQERDAPADAVRRRRDLLHADLGQEAVGHVVARLDGQPRSALALATGNVSPHRVHRGRAAVQAGARVDPQGVRAGAQKAGIRCSGGQCRQLPGFDGRPTVGGRDVLTQGPPPRARGYPGGLCWSHLVDLVPRRAHRAVRGRGPRAVGLVDHELPRAPRRARVPPPVDGRQLPRRRWCGPASRAAPGFQARLRHPPRGRRDRRVAGRRRRGRRARPRRGGQPRRRDRVARPDRGPRWTPSASGLFDGASWLYRNGCGPTGT